MQTLLFKHYALSFLQLCNYNMLRDDDDDHDCDSVQLHEGEEWSSTGRDGTARAYYRSGYSPHNAELASVCIKANT